MAEAAVTKKQRTTSKGNFTRKVNILKELLAYPEGIDIAEVEACFTDVVDAWKLVEQRHDAYNDALTDEDPSADAWIDEVQKIYIDARKAVLSMRTLVNEERDRHYRNLMEPSETIRSSKRILPI